MCSECADGYFNVIQKCYPCRDKSELVAFFVLLLLGWHVIVLVSRTVDSFAIILQWAQLANIIGDIHLKWAGMVTTLFGIASLLDLDVDIMDPTCLTSWGLRQKLLLQLALPFLLTGLGCSRYLGSVFAHMLLKRTKLKLSKRCRRFLSFLVRIPENESELTEKRDATIASLLASIDICYITIAKYCFDVFKCEKIAGVSVLRMDPSVACDERHAVTIIVASLGICVYVLGYPIFVCWKLYNLHCCDRFVDPVQLRKYGFIYAKYELDYYYTPAIVIVRKLLFILVLVYINNPAFQVGAIAVIINASLTIHVYTAPYVDTHLDVLFSFLLLALLFEAFGGLMFYSENLPDANRHILEWIVFITFLILVVVFVLIFVAEIVKKYHTLFLKKQHRSFARKNKGDGRSAQSAASVVNSPLARAVLDTVGSRELDKKISLELLDTFEPGFIYRCLKKNPEHIENWDRLTDMLKDYMADDSDTSYLSTDPVAKFWRRLVDRFPELVDFLAVADEDSRNKFNDFATNLYRNFYLSKKVEPLPLIDVLNWRDYAPLAQWLAIAEKEEREFFLSFMGELFETAGMREAADALNAKFKTGGPDPHLQRRREQTNLDRRGRRALIHINSGSSPFRHSAAEKNLNTLTTVAVGVSKFRLGPLRSKKKLSHSMATARAQTGGPSTSRVPTESAPETNSAMEPVEEDADH